MSKNKCADRGGGGEYALAALGAGVASYPCTGAALAAAAAWAAAVTSCLCAGWGDGS